MTTPALAPDRTVLEELVERDYPAEFEAWWANYRHRNREHADYSVKKQIAFDAFYFAARAEAAQPVGWSVPDGFVIVPKEPTEAMLQGACATHVPGQPMSNRTGGDRECPGFERRRRIWADMVAAAPDDMKGGRVMVHSALTRSMPTAKADAPVVGWQPIATAPECEEIIVMLSCGRTALAEYWPPAPIEIDPRQDSGGWATCLIGSGDPDLDLGLDARDIGDPVRWRPRGPQPPVEAPT